jgi:hypothetical protein
MVEIYLGILSYIGLSIWFTIEGAKRKIGWLKTLFISIFLTPLISGLIVFNSSKKISYFETHHKCPRCNYEFTESEEYCSLCAKDGHKVKLHQVKKEMT